MDVLPRIIRQLTGLFQLMSPLQRVTSLVVSCCILCGFGWLVVQHQQPEFQAVCSGKVFATEEISSAERALSASGLNGFRRDGRKLLAPAKELDRYNAVLLDSDAQTADLGAQMLKQYEKLGPFSTDRQRQQMKEASLLQELRRRIKEVPDIEDAHVVIASSERKAGWNQRPRTTANISLKPRAGRGLSSTLINSLRHVVANMVPDLKPADVTIFDVTRGQAFMGELIDDPTDSQYLQRAREFTRQYEQQIQKALSHIPSVNVTVHVDLDTLKSSLVRSETVRSRSDDRQVANQPVSKEDEDSHLTGFRGSNGLPTETIREVSEKQLVAAMPRAVQVCVTIPREFLREIAAHRLAKGEKSEHRLDPTLMEEEELAKVERIIGRLIPADSARDAISVTFVDNLVDANSPEAVTTPFDQMQLSTQQWGGFVAIGLFVFVLALWMLRSQRPVESSEAIPVAKAASLDVPPNATEAINDAVRTPQPLVDRMAMIRDEVRSMAESDPTASAALLGRWLSEVHC